MRDDLHVAFDGRSLAASSLRGWDRYTLELARELEHLGIKLSFFCRAEAPIQRQHLRGLDASVVALPDHGGLHWTQVALPKALKEHGCDLYHAPAEQGVPLLPMTCPVVLTVHSVISLGYLALVRAGELPGTVADYLGYELRLWSFAGLYWRAQILRANAIMAPSEYCRGEIIKHLGVAPNRVTTTLLGLPEVFRRPPKDAAERGIILRGLGILGSYLLSVGGYERHKNPHGLIEAFAQVSPLRPNMQLVMVGSRGVPNELQQLATSLGVQSKILFLVDVGDSLVELYDGAELFVSLSWLETFCLPALEAMSRGVLPVCSSWGALPEVLGDCGWCVDPRDIKGAAATWMLALNDPQRVLRAARAKSHATAFGWRQAALRTLAVYLALKQKASRQPFKRQK